MANPPLKKVTPPTAPATTAKTTAATAPSPSAQASSSEPPAPPEPVVPGPQPDAGPLVEVGESDQLHTLTGPANEQEPSTFQSFDLNGPAPDDLGLDAPAPVQNDHTPDLFAQGLLPPKPERLPDDGNCHIIWPGDKLTIDGHLDNGGVLVTNKRHYEAHLAPGSKTRWTFRLLYAAGAEVKDRRMVGLMITQPVEALSAS